MKRFILLLFCLVSLPCAAEVQPPKTPFADEPIRERDVRYLRMLTQPPELKAALEAIAQGSIPERVARLKKKALEDMVFVEGGSFMMDLWDHRHQVRLTSYSISRYKVTYAEFDTYTDATKTPRTGEDTFTDRDVRKNPFVPAGAIWQRARDYCQWVGKLTGLPFDLPTEAQWEYAARSRGKRFVFATDTGNIEHGRNVPGAREHSVLLNPIEGDSSMTRPVPIGLFPPNPLGLYDVAHNGLDWVLDWYDPDYYQHSPIDNPQGPDSGTEKVIRGGMLGEGHRHSTTTKRRKEHPQKVYNYLGVMEQGPVMDTGIRCVVNTPKPLPKP
jgi:formylglycine-generating enzyme required for sulfatase activity